MLDVHHIAGVSSVLPTHQIRQRFSSAQRHVVSGTNLMCFVGALHLEDLHIGHGPKEFHMVIFSQTVCC